MVYRVCCMHAQGAGALQQGESSKESGECQRTGKGRKPYVLAPSAREPAVEFVKGQRPYVLGAFWPGGSTLEDAWIGAHLPSPWRCVRWSPRKSAEKEEGQNVLNRFSAFCSRHRVKLGFSPCFSEVTSHETPCGPHLAGIKGLLRAFVLHAKKHSFSLFLSPQKILF